MPTEPTKQQREDDSDIDDLLDDVLDDLNDLSTAEKPAAPPVNQHKTTVADVPEEGLDDMLDSEEFSKQLAAGMEELMGQFGQDENMMEAFEKVWKSLDAENLTGAATDAESSSQTARDINDTTGSKPSAKSFQDTIAQTMDKLKDSSKQVDSSMAEENEDAFMAELMKQMESLTDGGEFENVLEGMMSQLMSKEMLYEPMKEMAQKYPEWLAENKDKITQAEYEDYLKQLDVCKQIVARYEDPKFDEKNEDQAKGIMELMTKMQDLGQPPASLLEQMAPGMGLGNGEGMPDPKDLENCNMM
ncbi:Pex19 protein [Radiomyces spectabilis]|uniref:Pex19 protein n=1 Tax=Radiomyces spectabilis TaxID=64574 RepID=UPI00221E959F|nr:Pex19 protein [Radiomyces spectabilis]KAI8388846.1 Pex19 protein [Radiomyces spectabilis]